MQKCIKLRVIKPYNDITWDELGTVFRDLCYASFKAANYVMRENYIYTITNSMEKKYFYPQLTEMFPTVGRHILSATEKAVNANWKKNKKDVLNNRISLPTFKQGFPVHLHNESYNLIKEDDNYVVDAQLRSKEFTPTRYSFCVAANDNSTRTILNRILTGEYIQGEAQLTKDRKNKWYFIIPYQFEPNYYDIDKNNIMGVDLGIAKAAYWAFNNSHKRGFIEGSEIEEFRRRVRKRRIEIQKQGKYCGEGRIGHGKDRRLLPIETLKEKETNFRDTCNHRYARHIVDESLKAKCGIIQMEDLTGINNLSKFLKNWPYFDLQTKIINKAAEYGIEVRKVKPDYTSQRCSNCGYIDHTNRLDQATFICKECGYGDLHHCFSCGAKQKESGACQKCGEDTKHLTINADYNAARNLSIGNIDEIITQTIESSASEKLKQKRSAKAKRT